jgi:hypothetical protein
VHELNVTTRQQALCEVTAPVDVRVARRFTPAKCSRSKHRYATDVSRCACAISRGDSSFARFCSALNDGRPSVVIATISPSTIMPSTACRAELRDDFRKGGRQVDATPRLQTHTLVGHERERAIAVELGLVEVLASVLTPSPTSASIGASLVGMLSTARAVRADRHRPVRRRLRH